MTRSLVTLFVLALAGVSVAEAKPPTVVTAFNAIDRQHPVKQAGSAWTTGKIAVTVDIKNGYLTFTDPKTKEVTTAALWKASNNRWFLGITNSGPSMSFWEVDSASDTPEEVQPSPLPSLSVEDLLMPDADAKLVAANAKAFPGMVSLRYELPRKGTTLIARVDVADLKKWIDASTAPAATKTKLAAIVDKSLYTRIECPYDDGNFEIGKKSKE